MMTGRAAYIHIGAMLGTFMSANVWLRILPFQRQMVVAVKKGIPPDLSLGSRAKQRTKHNNYMIVPVVFIMISNHFPVATYGSPYNWIILPLLHADKRRGSATRPLPRAYRATSAHARW